MSKKLQVCLTKVSNKMSAHKCAYLNFYHAVYIIKMHHYAKIGFAHTCADISDIFYSTNSDENGRKWKNKISFAGSSRHTENHKYRKNVEIGINR